MQYLQELGAADEASALLTEALAALPANPLMHFLAAEFEQQRKNIKVSEYVCRACALTLTII
jgi:hypothetical protein